MSALRDTFIAKAAVKTKLITVGIGDDALQVELHSLTAGVRGDLLNQCLVTTTGVDGEETTTTDLAKLGPMLVIAGACDPATHMPLFAEPDLELIAGLDAAFLDPVVKGVSDLSGISQSALASAEKNSAETTG